MIHDKNDPKIDKFLLKQINIDGRSKHKMELKNLLHCQETKDMSIGTSLLKEIRQAAFSQPTMLNNEDLPVSQETIDDFLNSTE